MWGVSRFSKRTQHLATFASVTPVTLVTLVTGLSVTWLDMNLEMAISSAALSLVQRPAIRMSCGDGDSEVFPLCLAWHTGQVALHVVHTGMQAYPSTHIPTGPH